MAPQTRILIVEDEQILAENMRAFLLKRALEVRIVTSGEAALDCVDDFAPDLLVLDYGLPGIDGLQTFAALRARQSHLAAVLITGHPSDQIVHAAAEVGIRHILSKPFAFSELAEILLADPGLPASGGDGEVHAMSESRRNGERRQINGGSTSSIPAADGRVTDEERSGDRRMAVDRRQPAPSPASGPT